MPIKQLQEQVKDGRRDLPVIGFLAKGAEKEGNKPGEDLPYWRFTANVGYEALEAEFLAVYGMLNQETGEYEPPTSLPIRLTNNLDDVLSYWLEERAGQHATLIHRCDGVTQSRWYDSANKTTSRRPVACVAAQGACQCGYVAYFKVMLPALIAKTGVWGVVLLRTSSKTDVEHLVKFTSALSSDLKAVHIPLSTVDLTLKRVAETIPYEDSTGKLRQREHFMVKVDYEPEWLKAHFGLMTANARPASEENEAPRPLAVQTEALIEQFNKNCERYLKMTVEELWLDYLRTGIETQYPTLPAWIEAHNRDEARLKSLITDSIVRHRLPCYIYGVRVERRMVNQAQGNSANVTYWFKYPFGFAVAQQFGRDPFKDIDGLTDKWIPLPEGENWGDVLFPAPIPVYITNGTERNPIPKVAAIAWDFMPDEGDSAPALGEWREADEVEQQRIDNVLDLLDGDEPGQAAAALNTLSDQSLEQLLKALGFNPDELLSDKRLNPRDVAIATIISASFAEQDSEWREGQADSADIPRSVAKVMQLNFNDLRKLAVQVGIDSRGNKLQIVDRIAKAYNLPEN